MRQLLRLLLYLAAGAILFVPGGAVYFESNANCGYPATDDWVHFEQSPELLSEPSLGVCGWGFDTSPQLQSRVDLCISCSFTPADQPTCRGGTVLVRHPVWHLAQRDNCDWQGCWLGEGACSNGTAVETALCATGAVNPKCCPFKRYLRCCQELSCTQRAEAAGQCVVQSTDLRPGQQFVGKVFAVPAATTDCYPYSFDTTRVCGADRTFPPGTAYGACMGVQVSRDLEGCVKLPGYDFYRGWQLTDASSWRLDDGTQWQLVAGGAGAQEQAARDMPLMAARCSATASCAAFQNTGNSTDLLYQLPTRGNWLETAASADYCSGIYAKSSPSTSCLRVSGYLFVPQYTLDATASSDFSTPAGAGPCSDCADAAALAVRCDSYGANGACAGFSNYHGLIIGAQGGGAGRPLLAEQPLTRFTSTPCAGMFVRAGRAFPQEVEELDQLLCGELVYCTGQLRYSASGQAAAGASYYVDLAVDFLTDFALPRGLLDATGGGLKQLPAVRSLSLRCLNGAVVTGGLPLAVAALMPFLQELRVQGCALTGPLSPALATLRYLRVLDLGQNRLTGPLPPSWAALTLGYLNLSSNLLTGPLPPSWQGILTPRAAPPPPPPPPLAAAAPASSPSPSPSAAATPPLAASQSALLVADLSANRLTGALDPEYIRGSCVARRLRMQLQGPPPPELLAALGDGGAPTFLLQYNPGVAAWTGRYEYAVADVRQLHAGGPNLCGAYRYKIALAVIWGSFGLALLAILACSVWAAVRSARRQRRQFLSDHHADAASSETEAEQEAEDHPAAKGGGAAAARAGRRGAGGAAGALSRLWARRWVRRLALLLRLGYLAADVALDVRVTVWLFAEGGDAAAAAACLAFIVVTQAAVSAALLGSLWHHFFSSAALAVALSPLLVAAGPVVGPVLALANIRNPDVPLVFWRYLELLEFCVALLQAPAQSVAQSVAYGRQNAGGKGMYLPHPLLLASIAMSLGDMLLAAAKLAAYKRGPLRRIQVAVTHLDKVRDPVDYRQHRLLSRSAAAALAAGPAGLLEAPLNPRGSALAAGQRQGQQLGGGGGGGGPPGEAAAGPGQRRDASGRGGLQLFGLGPDSGQQQQPGGTGGTGGLGAGAGEVQPADGGAGPQGEGVGVGAGAHTFTPLTPSRYKPSLLATSSHRLSASSSAAHAHAHQPPTPSRLGLTSGSSGRVGSVTIPAHPPLRTQLLSTPPTGAARSAAELASPSGTDSRYGSPSHASPHGGGGTSRYASPTRSSSARIAPAAEERPPLPAAAAAATASTSAASGAAAGGGGGGGSLSRRSRSVQEGSPPHSLLLGGGANPPLAASISSDVFGPAAVAAAAAAATGGHGPPPGEPGASASSRPSGGADAGPSGGGGGAAGPPHDYQRYLTDAAAAAAAALEEALGSTPRGMGDGASTSTAAAWRGGGGGAGTSSARPPAPPWPSPVPTRWAGGGEGPDGGRNGSPLRQAASAATLRSANASPARRRDNPTLSINVPPPSPEPGQGSGIQLIRMSTPDGAGALTSRASSQATTPMCQLPMPPTAGPPPRPPEG